MSFPSPPIPGSPTSADGEFNNPNPISNTGATNLIGPTPGSLTGPSPGSRSNVVNYTPDGLLVMQEAAEMAGVDLTTGYTLRSFKRSLEMLSMSWSNYGINLWTLEFEQFNLVPGTANYLIPADTVDILSASIRFQIGELSDGSPRYEDIAMARQDFDTYFSIPQKQIPGRPNTFFVHRGVVQPDVWLWPVPNNYKPYIMIYWRLRRQQNYSYATNIPDVPFRMIPALTKGLAWQVALKKKGQKDFNLITTLKGYYDEELKIALAGDRDRSSVYLAPFISRY